MTGRKLLVAPFVFVLAVIAWGVSKAINAVPESWY